MGIRRYGEELVALETAHTSYMIRMGDGLLPENVYWGKRIDRLEDFAGEGSIGIGNVLAPNAFGRSVLPLEACGSRRHL